MSCVMRRKDKRMANEEQPSAGIARYAARCIGAFIGTVANVGVGFAGACKETVMVEGERPEKISEEVAGKVAEPSFARATPGVSEGAETKAEVEEAEPEVPEFKARAKKKTKATTKRKTKKTETRAKKKTKATTKRKTKKTESSS